MDSDITKRTRHITEPGRRYNTSRRPASVGSDVKGPRSVTTDISQSLAKSKASQPRTVNTAKPALPRTKRSMVLRRQMVEKAEIHRKKVNKVRKMHFLFYGIAAVTVISLTAVVWSFKDAIPLARDLFEKEPTYSNSIDSDPEELSSLDERKPTAQVLMNQSAAPDAPKMIRIPKYEMEARIVTVGTTLTGEPISPKNIFDVGWYEKSGKPGNPGAVMLNGHIAGPTQPGVFARVSEIVAGDVIELERGDGQILKYTVSRVQEYSSAQLDMSAASNPIDASRQGLNLVTTMTKFSGTQKRIIVFAVM